MSSKSGTSKDLKKLTLDTPVQYIKGVGPKLAQLLASKGLSNVEDVIFYFPRDYQDRSKLIPISAALPETQALIQGKIVSHHYRPLGRGRLVLEARVEDGLSSIYFRWFHFNRKYMDPLLAKRPTVVAFGTVKSFGGKNYIIHPEVDWSSEDGEKAATSEKVLPIYSESEQLTQKTIRKIVLNALENLHEPIKEDLPGYLLREYRLPRLDTSIHFLHKPPKDFPVEELKNQASPAHARLIFEEFIKFELIIARKRMIFRQEETQAFRFNLAEPLYQNFLKRIPFELTEEQNSAIQKIHEDLSHTKPMSRLLQGDVGCGKTLVCMAAALPVIQNGGQAVLMAPTEILASQHLKNAALYLENLPIDQKTNLHCALLTGSTKKSVRKELFEKLACGEIHFLIGTHAVIEDDVRFKNLGFVIIDEQHRFGVDQRLRLRKKGRAPHTLSLTATPIPRTLALTAFGDLDVTTIRQLPKGRPPIHTSVVSEVERHAMYEKLISEVQNNRQGYVIYPLVEESEKLDLQNAISGAETLANTFLKNYRVGLLHGRMSAAEKEDIMSKFKIREIDVLVSTTVVEVGVDVPNATVLIIENAERFGLSQLHQLRGRVGRGTETSYCFLVPNKMGEVSSKRLEAMEKTRDGFVLAELDLEIRGPGDFIGTRQSGDLQFKIANLIRDQEWLVRARKAAFEILQKDPTLQLPEHVGLRQFMRLKGELSQLRFETA